MSIPTLHSIRAHVAQPDDWTKLQGFGIDHFTTLPELWAQWYAVHERDWEEFWGERGLRDLALTARDAIEKVVTQFDADQAEAEAGQPMAALVRGGE